MTELVEQLVFPIVYYKDMDSDKKKVVVENKGKSGVYKITNLINNKSYVGSSLNLGRRFTTYYSFKYIDSQKNSLICKALLKYGYSKFSLEILKYCSSKDLLSREQYYLDRFKPKYNILTVAGSSIGYKHSEETIKKFKARRHTKETIEKFKTKLFSQETRTKISASLGTKVLVNDLLTNNICEYDSIRKAAEGLNAPNSTIRYHAVHNKLYKDRYKITLNK